MFNTIYINKTNLINNIKQVKRNNPNSLVCAMVKANAYGVGVRPVAKILNKYVDFWGVANLNEAKKLKKLTNKKILIVGALEQTDLDESFSYACSSLEDVVFLQNTNKPYNIHLKINTGMNRFGFNSVADFVKALKIIKHSNLHFEGLFTHYATSDEFVETQTRLFKKYIKIAKAYKFKPIIHADNSVVNSTKNHHFDMVRIGFDLYYQNDAQFKPVVSIKTKIVQINEIKKGDCVGYNNRFIADKKMRVAVLPVGYADGFDMAYIGLTLNVGNKLCTVLNICMDCFMLDISATNLKKGESMFLLNAFNPIDLYSNNSFSNNYEVMTKFGHMRARRKLIVSPAECEEE